MKYVTIQKVSELSGISQSAIRKMLKSNELTPHIKRGYKRIFIDTAELEKQIQPIEKPDELDRFLV